MEEQEIKTTRNEPQIRLSKLTKGYTWEIKYSGEKLEDVVKEIERINKIMISKYGKKATKEKDEVEDLE